MRTKIESTITQDGNSYPNASAVERHQQQKRQEILDWLAEHAADAVRSTWCSA